MSLNPPVTVEITPDLVIKEEEAFEIQEEWRDTGESMEQCRPQLVTSTDQTYSPSLQLPDTHSKEVKRRKNTGKYTCKICNKKYSVMDEIRNHLYAHSFTKQWTCHLCKAILAASYSRPGSLATHYTTVHGIVSDAKSAKKTGLRLPPDVNFRDNVIIQFGKETNP